MKDYPYNILKQDERAYQLMLLRDQQNQTLADIAKEYGLSVARVRQIYHKIKRKQINLYINHISTVLGQQDEPQAKKVFDDANEWYRDIGYSCAYLEKQYGDILSKYRAGEPGMPEEFIKNMPPFQPEISKETIDCVIKMRENEKASYIAIAEKLGMTPNKARHTYEWFYHQKVLELIRKLSQKAESSKEEMQIWEHYFRNYNTSKKRYDALMKEINPSGGK